MRTLLQDFQDFWLETVKSGDITDCIPSATSILVSILLVWVCAAHVPLFNAPSTGITHVPIVEVLSFVGECWTITLAGISSRIG